MGRGDDEFDPVCTDVIQAFLLCSEAYAFPELNRVNRRALGNQGGSVIHFLGLDRSTDGRPISSLLIRFHLR